MAIGEKLLRLRPKFRIAVIKHPAKLGHRVGRRRFDGVNQAVHVVVLRLGQRFQ